MMKQRCEYILMPLALLAFVAVMPMRAWAGTVTVPSPTDTASIHLGVNDPPAIAKLDGWYCSDTPLKKTIVEMMTNVGIGLNLALEEGVARAVTWEVKLKYIDNKGVLKGKGWPFKLAGLEKSPVENGLDAPPGGTKNYTFKCCYTEAELQTLHDKVWQWLESVRLGTLIEGEGVDRELSIKYLGYPENYK